VSPPPGFVRGRGGRKACGGSTNAESRWVCPLTQR